LTKRDAADWQPGRVVGHLVSNETGTHLFCNWCVKADDPAYGTLHEIHMNQVEAGGRCSICGRIIKWASGAPHIERFADKLRQFYEGPIPADVVDAGKTYMVVTVSDFTGKRNLKITINNYLVYRFSSWGASGVRTIAGHEGVSLRKLPPAAK
jgi:hypothetical protein